ncbi:hypothetical protein FRX31_031592 [Thalictrum thalictroides]|uniref:Uncharacterized protein n=1 Tax=Thalictrum thalictroides TaxID=46969 RepID=A0A7J6V1Y9_THATH|nr:hypothetical protein FRX31_031592 [Thalictrum thalictroides]
MRNHPLSNCFSQAVTCLFHPFGPYSQRKQESGFSGGLRGRAYLSLASFRFVYHSHRDRSGRGNLGLAIHYQRESQATNHRTDID